MRPYLQITGVIPWKTEPSSLSLPEQETDIYHKLVLEEKESQSNELNCGKINGKCQYLFLWLITVVSYNTPTSKSCYKIKGSLHWSANIQMSDQLPSKCISS